MQKHLPLRRRTVLAAGLCTLGANALALSDLGNEDGDLRVGGLLAGHRHDGGFMESGWRGFERARTELGVRVDVIDGVAPVKNDLVVALIKLIESGANLVVAHGGQHNDAVLEVSKRFPITQFVVTQGAVAGDNLASYDVLQEESAYLGGVLAALTTKTGVVGHMSGIRVGPGLKGRAAYVAGVKATNPDVQVLTNFSGNQDDNALSKRVALAEIDAGADVIFTMLNAGRKGAIDACRERGVRQIGNVGDWTATDPQVFIASAMADVGAGVFESILNAKEGNFRAGLITHLGIGSGDYVRLAMAPDVPADVRARVAAVSHDIAKYVIKVPTAYDGAEFPTPA